jgi:hypothetical protein
MAPAIQSKGADDGASVARQSFREVNASNHGDRKKILWVVAVVVVVVYIASLAVYDSDVCDLSLQVLIAT